MIQINAIEQEKIKITSESTPNGGKIVFEGDIDMVDPGPLLDPLFENIHTQVVEGSVKSITIDFTNLTFLNSSGIKAIAKWIMRLATLPDNQKYKILIKHNPEITWQMTSLPTLTYLVPGTVEIT